MGNPEQAVAVQKETRNELQPEARASFTVLNEGPLHAAVKAFYAEPGGRTEVPVDGYVIDVVQGDLLIEVQTSSFGSIKRKLAALVPTHQVRLVFPVAREKWLVDEPCCSSETPRRRKSPRRGEALDLFPELLRFPQLVAQSNFSVDILFTREEELRRRDTRKGWRRHGWVTVERRLLDVLERRTFAGPADFAALLPGDLPAPFTVLDLASALGRSRAFAQKMVYCLSRMGAVESDGKRGHAALYRQLLPPEAVSA